MTISLDLDHSRISVHVPCFTQEYSGHIDNVYINIVVINSCVRNVMTPYTYRWLSYLNKFGNSIGTGEYPPPVLPVRVVNFPEILAEAWKL